MENAIEIRGLCKNWPSFQLKNVDITLPKGYIMGFIGANGAGKSTTISLLTGRAKADGGSCKISGVPTENLSARQKEDIGLVLDECPFPETLNYKEINKFMKNIYSHWDNAKFLADCAAFGLNPKQPVNKYSKGMKMKLSIAAATCHGAKTLILDEATSGLDPVVRDEILDMLLDFVQDEENSVFMSSHITSDLEKVCDYITFINDGRIVFSMTKDEVDCTYGMLRCSAEEFENIDKSRVVHARKNAYSVDALVYREKIGPGHIIDKASLEDIMLYYVKEGKH